MAVEARDCHYPWTWMTVSSNGDVRPCCYARPVGNLRDVGPEQIWNGRNMQELRRSVIGNKVDVVCSQATCKYINGKKAGLTFRQVTYRWNLLRDMISRKMRKNI